MQEKSPREKVYISKNRRNLNSSKKINFFITSKHFPSLSVTGSSCALMCKHCKGKLIEALVPAKTSEDLEKKALQLYKQGAKGLLLTGGCDLQGKVPLKSLTPAIKKIKERIDLILIAHTGFISGDEAKELKNSGLDGIGFDVIGDMSTAKEVYGLEVSEKDYVESLRAIESSGLMVFPHVCVGLHFGELKGEYHALEIIRAINPCAIIITGLMPVLGTPMENIKPKIVDFEKVIKKAIKMFPTTPVVLGCAHSTGKDRAEIEMIALKSGVSGIALPTLKTVNFAKENGYEINYYGTCCGLIPEEKTRIII